VALYANRQRIVGNRGKQLLRRRGHSGTWWRVYFSFDLAHERAESTGTFTPGCNLASNAESPAALNSTTRWPKSTVLARHRC
jgi:hypothetical protein